ncbi:MAG TPA: bifunctional riboflavin kinase/FAD synthetase [Bdellovibrionota bacterium]|nr:bifunctional riboflavin kinase/FAD synthetase [Bdellovibrionota bacterium]
MQVIQGIENLDRSPPGVILTIGNFDGVHRGHQEIIRLARERARRIGGTCVAFTFRPHPQTALKPGVHVQLLSTYDEKLELLSELGVDMVIEQPFSREFSSIECEDFFNDIILHRLSADSVIVGYDFSFGKERRGHLTCLESLCKSTGVELTIVPPQRMDGEVVSSSRIRQHLLNAEIEEANHLLGRPFSYRGIVIKGERRGHQLGFPTANLKLEAKLTLPFGVYATIAIPQGTELGPNRPKSQPREYFSVTNIGTRPTFQAEGGSTIPALAETHLIGTTLDLYGNSLEVRFLKQLRHERRFSGMDELKHQIGLDIEAAQKFFRSS